MGAAALGGCLGARRGRGCSVRRSVVGGGARWQREQRAPRCTSACVAERPRCAAGLAAGAHAARARTIAAETGLSRRNWRSYDFVTRGLPLSSLRVTRTPWPSYTSVPAWYHSLRVGREGRTGVNALAHRLRAPPARRAASAPPPRRRSAQADAFSPCRGGRGGPGRGRGARRGVRGARAAVRAAERGALTRRAAACPLRVRGAARDANAFWHPFRAAGRSGCARGSLRHQGKPAVPIRPAGEPEDLVAGVHG